MILQNIWRGVVVYDLVNISPSTISPNMLLSERFHSNCQAILAAMRINGLRDSLTKWKTGGKKEGAHFLSQNYIFQLQLNLLSQGLAQNWQ